MRMQRVGAAIACATVLVASLAMPVTGLAGDEADFQAQMQAMEWRNVGPFNASGDTQKRPLMDT